MISVCFADPPGLDHWTAVARWMSWWGADTPEQRRQMWGLLRQASLFALTAVPLVFVLPRWAGNAFFDRFVGGATPEAIGRIRCCVFLILLFHLLSEDVPGIALLPPSLRHEMGVMSLLHRVPGWDSIYNSRLSLGVLKLVTIAAMGAAMVGWKTRWSVPCAALLGLICGGVLREYSHYFHQYLVPLQLALLLSFLPCGDGFSVDHFLLRQRGDHQPRRNDAVYGWSRYACWILIAGAYFAAGLSKLRNGGWYWWHGLNLKNIVLTDTLEPKQHEWGLERFLTDLPLEVFALLGLVGLLTELLYGLVLVSRTARLVMPILAVGLHTGIVLGQGILFFDLILIQAIFLWDFWPGSQNAAGGPVAGRHGPVEPSSAVLDLTGFRICLCSLVFVLFCWALRIEQYPASAWQMYSGRRDSDRIIWRKIYAVFADGHREEASPEQWVSAMPATRYTRLLHRDSATKEDFCRVVLQQANLHRPENPLVSVEVVTYEWHFLSAANDPEFGTVSTVWECRATDPNSD